MRTECSGKALGCPPLRPLQEAVTEMKRTAALLNTASLQTPLSERPCWRLHQDRTGNAKVFPKPSLVLFAAFTVSCGEGAGRECDAGDSRDRASCGPQQPMGFSPHNLQQRCPRTEAEAVWELVKSALPNSRSYMASCCREEFIFSLVLSPVLRQRSPVVPHHAGEGQKCWQE